MPIGNTDQYPHYHSVPNDNMPFPSDTLEWVCAIIFIHPLQIFSTERYLDIDTDNLKSPHMDTCSCMPWNFSSKYLTFSV